MFQRIVNELRITWRLIQDPRVPLWAKMIPVAAVLYILSPLDLIPDVLIGLGQLDDLGVFLGALRLLQTVTPAHVVEEHRAVLEGRPAGDVIETREYTVRSK